MASRRGRQTVMSEAEICRGDQGEIWSRVLHGLICWFAGRSWANAEASRTSRVRREESDESDSQNQDNQGTPGPALWMVLGACHEPPRRIVMASVSQPPGQNSPV